MKEADIQKFADTISYFRIPKEEIEAFNDVMIRAGVEAAKAGESLRKLILSLKDLKTIKPKYKQWQQPYKYHS